MKLSEVIISTGKGSVQVRKDYRGRHPGARLQKEYAEGTQPSDKRSRWAWRHLHAVLIETR
jgi:hypothetical protein